VHQPTEPRLLDRADTTAVEPDPLDELDELVTWALARSLPDRDLQLLRLLVRGCSVPEVAAELEISVRSVANHRDAMVHRLRQAARSVAAA
jgi:DNA-binding NarL/FixJ family response regulator